MLARYRSRILVTHFLLAAAATIATPAQAAVDMTGPWRVGFASAFGIVEARFDFVQAGTDLSGNGYSGTIDPDTGVFELSKTKSCFVFPNPDPIPVTATISGTVAPDGQSFTGTALDYVQAGRTCLAVDAQTQGLRLPPGCGDGDVDPDEACDPGVSSQCCTSYCTPNGPGLFCTDDGNPCTRDVCDGAGSCAHPAGNAGVTCRLVADECDAAELCDGVSADCPSDIGLPDTDNDTVCDAIDNCDAIANTSQDNNDSDPLGDACDPCTNIVPTTQSKAKLTLTKLLAPVNDDKVTFSSIFSDVPASPPIDPVANGARFLITDSTGAIPVDITIPLGAYDAANKVGWKVNGSGTSWTYKNAGTMVPLVNGITSVQIKRLATPGQFKTKVKGKNGSYAVNTANLPLMATVVIDPPFASTGQCGEAGFGVPPAQPSCLALSGGNTVKCK